VLADALEIEQYTCVLRALQEANVRLGYAMNRRPAVYAAYAVVLALLVALVWWLLGGDLVFAVIFSVTFTVVSVLVRHSDFGRRRFARWADKHPYPSS